MHNMLWLEGKWLLVPIHVPIKITDFLDSINEFFIKKSPKFDPNAAILVDASELYPPLCERTLEDFQKVLINLESRGLVIVYGMPRLVEHLIKTTLFSHPISRYPIYFAANQDEAVKIVHQQQSINTAKQFNNSLSGQQMPEGGKAKFRNTQTEQLYQAFVSDPELYRTWRTMVNGLYEDGEIAFETVVFAQLHQYGDTRDLSIDWDQVIMALLYDTDL